MREEGTVQKLLNGFVEMARMEYELKLMTKQDEPLPKEIVRKIYPSIIRKSINKENSLEYQGERFTAKIIHNYLAPGNAVENAPIIIGYNGKEYQAGFYADVFKDAPWEMSKLPPTEWESSSRKPRKSTSILDKPESEPFRKQIEKAKNIAAGYQSKPGLFASSTRDIVSTLRMMAEIREAFAISDEMGAWAKAHPLMEYHYQRVFGDADAEKLRKLISYSSEKFDLNYIRCCVNFLIQKAKIDINEGKLAQLEEQAAKGGLHDVLRLARAYENGELCYIQHKKALAAYMRAYQIWSGREKSLEGQDYIDMVCSLKQFDNELKYNEEAYKSKKIVLLGTAASVGNAETAAQIANYCLSEGALYTAHQAYNKGIEKCRGEKGNLTCYCHNIFAYFLPYTMDYMTFKQIFRDAAMIFMSARQEDRSFQPPLPNTQAVCCDNYRQWLESKELKEHPHIQSLAKDYLENRFSQGKQQTSEWKPVYDGSAADMQKEIRYLSKQAAKGISWAAFTLGNIYFYGCCNTERNIGKAKSCYRIALRQDKPMYVAELERIYADPHYAPRDLKKYAENISSGAFNGAQQGEIFQVADDIEEELTECFYIAYIQGNMADMEKYAKSLLRS